MNLERAKKGDTKMAGDVIRPSGYLDFFADELAIAERIHGAESEGGVACTGSEAPSLQVPDGKVAEFSWQDAANCLGVDPDLFFPERGASTKEAKETCRGCVVREDCLETALANGEKFGIWGGMSERERRRIRSQRAKARQVGGVALAD